MPIKRLIDARRRRKGPPHGFGWIDHRLLRDGYLGRCSTQSLALYVLLVCASDCEGLSYYSDQRISELLGLTSEVLRSCRRELIGLGLIAYQKPLYQLLNLEAVEVQPRCVRAQGAAPQLRSSEMANTNKPSLKAMVEKLLQQQRSEPDKE